jgi:hypothetical protein
MGDEPILEPPADVAPPPSEVESYPAAAGALAGEPSPSDAPPAEAWPERDTTAAAAAAATAAAYDPPPPPPEVPVEASAEEASPAPAEPEPPADPEQLAEPQQPAAAEAAAAVPGESTQCPRCGTENQAGLSFCRNCGQRLVAAGVASTVERPATPEGTQACPRCGTHNRAGVAFCQNCGANLRGTAPGYVPPAVAGAPVAAAEQASGGAVLGPVVLLIGLIGLVTAYLLPFTYGTTSLYERALGSDGYGISFWTAMPEGGLADTAYFALAAAVPVLGLLLLFLAIAGFVRARPGPVAVVGLVIALAWSVALAVLFVVVEVGGNWSGDIVGLLRVLSPAGIILFLSSLIVIIGTLTRFGRS